MTTATQDSWTTHPLPEQHARLTADWNFNRGEFEQMKQGLIPEVMEEKWFIYHASGWLHFHRSWTGFCIYQVQLQERDSGYTVEQILVSRDVDQYRKSSDAYDLKLLRYLIDYLLLGKEVEFPQPEEIQGRVSSALFQHHLVGQTRRKPENNPNRQKKDDHLPATRFHNAIEGQSLHQQDSVKK